MSNKNKQPNTMKCEDIQAHLFAYTTHDTGQGRTEIIKKHLEECENCRIEAAQIKEAVNFLHDVAHTDGNIPTKLTEKRRALIARSFMHPVLDFIYRHHIIISIITAIIAITVTLCALRQIKIWHSEKLDLGISVSLGKEK
jgi:predicted anti-sigma-YlaC factor YlaD